MYLYLSGINNRVTRDWELARELFLHSNICTYIAVTELRSYFCISVFLYFFFPFFLFFL